jgi:hypothetical protein
MPSQDGGTECTLKFGSWTYFEDSIDVQLRMEEMNLSEYKEHLVYILVNATAERNEFFYSCCPESSICFCIEMCRLISIIANYSNEGHLCQFNLSKPNTKVGPKVVLVRQVSPYQYYKQRY